MPFKRLINWLYPEDDEDELESHEEMPPPPAQAQDLPARKAQRGPLLLRSSSDGGMEIRHPRTLDDRMAIGMDLKHRRLVTLDLTRLPDSEARYFLEFIYGVVFALDATAEKVTTGIYLLAPHGVPVRNDGAAEEEAPEAANRPTGRATSREKQDELFWQGGCKRKTLWRAQFGDMALFGRVRQPRLPCSIVLVFRKCKHRCDNEDNNPWLGQNGRGIGARHAAGERRVRGGRHRH